MQSLRNVPIVRLPGRWECPSRGRQVRQQGLLDEVKHGLTFFFEKSVGMKVEYLTHNQVPKSVGQCSVFIHPPLCHCN